jgi:hypothetical protein
MKLPSDESCLLCLEGWEEAKMRKVKDWLKGSRQRYAAVIERDPSLLLKVPQETNLRLFIAQDENEQQVFRQIAWHYLFLPIFTTSKGLQEVHTEVNGFAADFADRGISLVTNARNNLQNATLTGRSLFGKLEGVPAIVCGAGPSLAKNGRLLQDIQDRAFVIAGGAAVESLRRLGVTPHFAAHVDPDPAHPFLKQMSYDIPLFYQLRTSHEVVVKGTGPKLLMEGSGNFPLETWAQAMLGMSEEPFDSGWTVGCYAMTLAFHLGCNPIILIGMDLQEEKYDWKLAAEWIDQFGARETSRRWINSTEGGIGFNSFENLPLAAILKTLTTSYPTISTLASQATPLIGGPAVARQMSDSLSRAESYVTQMLEGGVSPLLEHDLEQELAEQKILSPIWQIWKYPILRYNAHGDVGEQVNRLIFAQDVYRALSRN